jgi:hypothetical protein
MAKQDPNGTQKYWYDGNSSTAIKTRLGTNIGSLTYWYNGKVQGFLVDSVKQSSKKYAILIGF